MPIFTVTAAEREATVVDGIAAVVNGEVITYSQVRALSAPQERMLRQQYTGQELASKLTELRELAVKDLIDRRLVIQAFKKESFEIPDHLVDMRIQRDHPGIFGGDRNTFVKTLEAQNFTLGEFKQKEMEKIIVGAMKGHNVKTNSVVSPTKIEEYYRKHRDEFTSKEQIKLRMIMISGHKDTATRPRKKNSLKKCSASSPVARNLSKWRRCIRKTARRTTAATGAGSNAKLWRSRWKSSHSTCPSAESATSSITPAIITS